MHKCYVCKEHKSAENFNKDPSRGSGLMSKCKPCLREFNRIKRATVEGKAHRVVLSRKWKRENREKERAHKKVADAVKSKRLIKPTDCSKCGSRIKIEGHHPDYSKPLEVIWWCQVCHLNYHKEVWSAAR